MMTQPYDINTIADGLRRRRVQLASEAKGEKRRMRRTVMETEEREELEGLIAGGADREAVKQWGRDRGLNGNTVRSAYIDIARDMGLYPQRTTADVWAENGHEPPAPEALSLDKDARPQPTALVVESVAQADPTLRAWVNATNPLFDWINRIHSLRDELKALGVTVEGTIGITIDL